MNNIATSLKKFVTNKNTVTVLVTILIVGILLVFYNYTLNQELKEVNIVIAKTTIEPNTEITESMLEVVKIPQRSLPAQIVRNIYQVAGKYSRINSVIPAGSFIFEEMVQSEETKKDIYKEKLDEGEIAFKFKVDVNSTYGNSIVVGEYINIYMKAEDTSGKIIFGELLKDVEVIAVKDSNGTDIYQIAGNSGTPNYLYLGVKEEIHEILLAATFLDGYGVELFPVITGETIDVENGETLVSNEILEDYLKLRYDYYQSYKGQQEDIILDEQNQEEQDQEEPVEEGTE